MKSPEKLKLQKRSSEDNEQYINRLYRKFTPLNKIYSRDRYQQEENIKNNIYYKINENWNKFFMEKFKENKKFYVSIKTSIMDLAMDEFDELVLPECYTIYNMEHDIVDKFINPDIDVIVIPYTINIYNIKNGQKFLNKKILDEGVTFSEIQYYAGHSCCVIINKFLKTIEFYDPNGAIAHKILSCDNLDEEMMIEELYMIMSRKQGGEEIKNYKLYKNIDICPKIGPQILKEISAEEREFKKNAKINGWCIVWSILNAYIRIKYYMVEPQIILEILLQKIEEMYDDEYWNWLRNWILHIMKTIELVSIN